ncbi:uncharacterized protein LOC126657193 [Mercurialis annua]|uniref:uncharacterized protein LOC126657193 n=1 Tax=Mercurialis annua TaxID=3986 RepID=UPI00215FD2DF|nr:uncharacterized protein LOC126657193 [Mercurialis annua]
MWRSLPTSQRILGGVDPKIISHKLNVDAKCKPVKQKKRTFSLEKQIAIRDEVEKLSKAGFIRKVDYPEWLANVVLIKKSNAEPGKVRFRSTLGEISRASHLGERHRGEPGENRGSNEHESTQLGEGKECNTAFEELKVYLSTPPVLGRPEPGEILYLYLSVNDETAAAVLVKEDKGLQTPVYYLSRVLKGPEVAAEKLRRYFEAHIIVVHFIAETTASDQPEEPDEQLLRRVLEVDGASNLDGSGAGVVLKGPHGVTLRSSVKFDFPASNNAAEYEALLIGLRMVNVVKAEHVTIRSDSQLVVCQTLATVNEKIPGVHFSVQKHSSIDNYETIFLTQPLENWMQGIAHYLMDGTLPENRDKAYKILRQAPYYAFLDGVLYRKSFTHPWSRCLTAEEGEYVLREIHEGICGAHIAPRMLAKKAVLQGYYWPLMVKQAEEIVKKCENCQRHQNIRHAPTTEQCPITSPWPFTTWGIDILGPFTPTTGQKKFLIVAVDHFTKWLEVEAVSTITEARIRDFFWRQIVCRFGIPRALVTDNGKQFNCRAFKEFCNDLHIDLRFTSVVHPQSNGMTEVTNRTILKGLKARLGEFDRQWLEELPKEPILAFFILSLSQEPIHENDKKKFTLLEPARKLN